MIKTRLATAAVAFVLSVGLLFASSVPANAVYGYYGSYTFSTGTWLDRHYYTGLIYRDPGWVHLWYGSTAVSSGFEYKGATEIVLTQSRSFTLASQTVTTLNASLNPSVFGIKAGIGGSIATTTGTTWAVSNTTQRTIPASASRGYYSYNVLMNTYMITVVKTTTEYVTFSVSVQNRQYIAGTVEFVAPRSEPYRALIYNPSNASYASGWRVY